MTSDQIAYHANEEVKRHNYATEALGFQQHLENVRKNKAQEALGWAGNALARDQLEETKRHNVITEGLSLRNVEVAELNAQSAAKQANASLQQARAARKNAIANARQAEIAQQNADINQQKADTAEKERVQNAWLKGIDIVADTAASFHAANKRGSSSNLSSVIGLAGHIIPLLLK